MRITIEFKNEKGFRYCNISQIIIDGEKEHLTIYNLKGQKLDTLKYSDLKNIKQIEITGITRYEYEKIKEEYMNETAYTRFLTKIVDELLFNNHFDISNKKNMEIYEKTTELLRKFKYSSEPNEKIKYLLEILTVVKNSTDLENSNKKITIHNFIKAIKRTLVKIR